jgi:arylsulfatase A-like enzyme
LKNLAIEDVAPTVLHLMGLPVPSDMDGRAITEILSTSAPVQRGAPLGVWPSESDAVYREDQLSEEDEDVVRQRLQALGYLD